MRIAFYSTCSGQGFVDDAFYHECGRVRLDMLKLIVKVQNNHYATMIFSGMCVPMFKEKGFFSICLYINNL